MSWARPSELARALECPASTVLPKEPEDPLKKTGDWGKEVHSWKETGFPPTPRVADWLTYQAIDPWLIRERQWGGGDHEVLLSFGPNFEPWALVGGTRDAFPKDQLIRGITDWVGLTGPLWHINDLKTGSVFDHELNEPKPEPVPAETPQLILYGDIWLRLHPREPGLLLSLDQWPRYPKGQPPYRVGPDYVERRTIDDWHNGRLIPAIELSKSPGAKLDARPGEWCKYCKSRPWCIAQGGVPPNDDT